MAATKKGSVSGKTVKVTTYSLLNPFKKDVKMVNERTTRKPTVSRNPKKVTGVTPLPKKITPGTPRPSVKPKPKGPIKKTPTATSKPKPKAPLPTTKSGDINPFNMTPQQKSDYLRNPGRYSRG